MTSGARSMGGAHPPRRPPLLRRGQPAARHSASTAGPRGFYLPSKETNTIVPKGGPIEWTTFLVGAVCLILAVIITLPIPLGHVIPGTAIVILALGLLERDGVALSIGLFVGFLALVIVFLALAVLAAVLHSWFAQ